MCRQVFEELAVLDVPNTDTFVHGTTGEEVAGGIEAETEDIVCMTSENFDTLCLQRSLAMIAESGEEQYRRSITGQSCHLNRMPRGHSSVTRQCH